MYRFTSAAYSLERREKSEIKNKEDANLCFVNKQKNPKVDVVF